MYIAPAYGQVCTVTGRDVLPSIVILGNYTLQIRPARTVPAPKTSPRLPTENAPTNNHPRIPEPLHLFSRIRDPIRGRFSHDLTGFITPRADRISTHAAILVNPGSVKTCQVSSQHPRTSPPKTRNERSYSL
ncbi:MAG: hypothetical protein C4583_03850 [Anaerolineaceae bacterium]|nr:MAG: hypothetical protein C4583_03850 [Anaerolineaceae bacterium]